jgi:hypothetical protein
VQLVVDYLDRVGQLWPEPRRRIGERLVDRVGGPELDPETRAKLIASPETLETFLRDRIRESR